MSREFEGKVAIVTGASSGIGQATAIAFAKEGAKVVLSGRNEKMLEAIREKCIAAEKGRNSKHFVTVAGDLNELTNIMKVVSAAVDTLGGVDLVVTCHGMGSNYKPMSEVTEEEFDSVMHTNVKSHYQLFQKAMPHLEKSKGAIVAVSSIDSIKTGMGYSPYMTSKAAIDHMIRCIASEKSPKGVRANTVNPCTVEPENNSIEPEFYKAMAGLIPMARCCRTQEVVNAILFLCSSKASFTTGGSIRVDGGIALSMESVEYD